MVDSAIVDIFVRRSISTEIKGMQDVISSLISTTCNK